MINRPIRTDTEYKAALIEIERFFADEPRKGTPEADRFDLLALLIETWEEQHHPIGPPHPVEMIRHRMRTAGYTQADLATLLGSRARASEVLEKKRRLTLEMMRKLDFSLVDGGAPGRNAPMTFSNTNQIPPSAA